MSRIIDSRSTKSISFHLGKAEEELPAGLEAVDGVYGLVDLVVEGLYLLLAGGGEQEVVHLRLQSVVNLHTTIII